MHFNRWLVAFLLVSLGCLRPAIGSADDGPCPSNPLGNQDCKGSHIHVATFVQ
jgi:hypothetical protein